MKQFHIFITLLILLIQIQGTHAQTVEFNYEITTVLPDGGAGNAGVLFIDNQFWVSEWNSDDIHVLDDDGNYIETFQIAGVTNTRAMTTDGTSVYCSSALSTIHKVNPVTKTLVSTITTSSGAVARFCAYDATLNAGLGGFWIGNWNSDITSIDMNGNELSAIPAATHGFIAMYGGAVDNLGNLYVYNQDNATSDRISVIDLTTGAQTGVHYDVFTNIVSPLGGTSSLAGGLFISEEVIPGKKIVIGLTQGSPNNILFGIDFQTGLSLKSFNVHSKITLYPNPSINHINFSGLNASEAYLIYNNLGVEIKKGRVSNNEKIDISDLNNGLYFISFGNGNTLKFIKK